MPESFGELPERFGQLPEGAGELPGWLGQFPGRAGQLPGSPGQLPENFGELPERFGELPKRFGLLPGSSGQLPEKISELPEPSGQLPERAGKGPQPSRLEKLETVQGAATVRKAGQVLVVTLPSQDGNGRWFRVEAGSEGASSFPAGFRAAEAQVHHWKGHLVLIAGGKAWHFSVPGSDRFFSAESEAPDVANLVHGYDVTEVRVSAIYSASGPRAARLNDGL